MTPLLKMNSLPSHQRFARCGRTKADTNGRTHKKECSRKRKRKTKAQQYAMNTRNLDTS